MNRKKQESYWTAYPWKLLLFTVLHVIIGGIISSFVDAPSICLENAAQTWTFYQEPSHRRNCIA